MCTELHGLHTDTAKPSVSAEELVLWPEEKFLAGLTPADWERLRLLQHPGPLN